MREMTTNELTKAALNYLDAVGWKDYMWRQNNLAVKGRKFIGKKGVPDLIGIHRKTGGFLAMEIKAGKDKASKEQITFIDDVNKTPYGHAAFIKTYDDVIKFVKSYPNNM